MSHRSLNRSQLRPSNCATLMPSSGRNVSIGHQETGQASHLRLSVEMQWMLQERFDLPITKYLFRSIKFVATGRLSYQAETVIPDLHCCVVAQPQTTLDLQRRRELSLSVRRGIPRRLLRGVAGIVQWNCEQPRNLGDGSLAPRGRNQ